MAITVVQSAKTAATTASFTSNTTAGNLVVAIFGSAYAAAVPSVSAVKLGTGADNFTFAAEQQTTGIGGFEDVGVFIWYDYNCVGGQKTVSFSGSNLSAGGTAIYEISGLIATALALDQTNNTGSTTSSPYSSGNITTTNPSEIVFGAAVGTSVSSPSGWTNQTETGFVAGYKILSGTTTLAYSGTDTNGWAAVIASFQAPIALAPKVVQANQAVMRAAVW